MIWGKVGSEKRHRFSYFSERERGGEGAPGAEIRSCSPRQDTCARGGAEGEVRDRLAGTSQEPQVPAEVRDLEVGNQDYP